MIQSMPPVGHGCSAASGAERRVFKDDVTDDRRSRRQTTQGLTWNLAASCSVFLHIAQVMAGKVKVERGLRRVTAWQRQAQMHTLLVKAPETAGTACWHWHLMNEYECTSFTLKWKFLNKAPSLWRHLEREHGATYWQRCLEAVKACLFSQILPVASAHLGSLPVPFHRLHLTPQRLALASAFVLKKSNREVQFQWKQ